MFFRVQSYLLIRCLDAQGLVKDQRQNKSEHDEQFAFVSRHFCYFFHHGIHHHETHHHLGDFLFDCFLTTEQSQIQESEVSHGVPPLWLGDSPKKKSWRFFLVSRFLGPTEASYHALISKRSKSPVPLGEKNTTTKRTHPLAWDMYLLEKWRNIINPYLILTYISSMEPINKRW